MALEGEELDKLAAEMLIAEATRAQEFAKTGGALGYMEFMKRRKPNNRFAGAVVKSTVRANAMIVKMQAAEQPERRHRASR